MSQTLAAIIEETRQTKRLTVAELTKQAGVSQATYNRMRNGQADVKLSALMGLLEALRLELVDVAPVLKTQYLQAEQWQQRIEATAGAVVRHQKPAVALGTLAGTLADSAMLTSSRELLQDYLALLQAKIADAQADAAAVAQQLWVKLARLARWTQFEWALFLPIIGYLDWAALQSAYRRFFGDSGQAARASLLDAVYLAMLANTIQSGASAHVRAVCAWCQQRTLADDQLYFAVVQNFTRSVDAWLAGQKAQAAGDWQTLQAALEQLWRREDGGLALVLSRLWEGVQTLAQARLTPQPALSAASAPVGGPAAAIARVRGEKGIAVGALWEAMFLSKAAYYRQFGQDSTLRVNEFFTAADCLRLQAAELGTDSRLAQTRRAVQQTVADVLAAKKAPQALAQWRTTLEKLGRQRASVGYRQLACWLAVVQAEQAQRPLQAATHALRLYRMLVEYDAWTAFEYSLLLPILRYLPFAQVAFLFKAVLDAPAANTQIVGGGPEALTAVYLGLWQSALNAGDPAALRLALAHLQARTAVPSLRFGLYQRLGACVAAPAATAALMRTVARTCGPAAPAIVESMRRLSEQTQTLLATETAQ